MKYIIFDKVEQTFDVPVAFPEFISHGKMAALIGEEVLAAGFAKEGQQGFECFGESHDFPDKPPRPEDARLIKSAFRRF